MYGAKSSSESKVHLLMMIITELGKAPVKSRRREKNWSQSEQNWPVS